jgi:hypothetical protein
MAFCRPSKIPIYLDEHKLNVQRFSQGITKKKSEQDEQINHKKINFTTALSHVTRPSRSPASHSQKSSLKQKDVPDASSPSSQLFGSMETSSKGITAMK